MSIINEELKANSDFKSVQFDFTEYKKNIKNLNLEQFLIIKYYTICQEINDLKNNYNQNLTKLFILEKNILVITKHFYYLLLFLSFYTFLISCIFIYLLFYIK